MPIGEPFLLFSTFFRAGHSKNPARERVIMIMQGAGSEWQNVRNRHGLQPKNRNERSVLSPRDIQLGLHNTNGFCIVFNNV